MELDDKNRDRLDRWLDGALRQYGNVEPRVGLERRILANLEFATPDRISSRGWWWVFATAAMMACIAAAVWIRVDLHHATKKAVEIVNPANFGFRTKGSQSAQPQVAKTAAHRARRSAPRLNIAAAGEPRMEQFPSERPLSEQEQMLSRYVKEFPQQAVLVARAQAESQKELDRLIADESSN